MCTDCSFRRARAPRPVRTPPLPSPFEVAPGLDVYPRSGWAGDSRLPTGDLYPEEVSYLIVHHSAGPANRTEAEAIAEMQEIYDYQTGPNLGWADVGYNFFIDSFGRVFEGRNRSLIGAVAPDVYGGNPGFGLSICLLGDFSTELPTPQAQDALTKTLAWLADRHELETGPDAEATFTSRGSSRFPEGAEVTINTISGHRTISDTTCPGNAFRPIVNDELPTLVTEQRAGGTGETSGSTAGGAAPSTTDFSAFADSSTTTSSATAATTSPATDTGITTSTTTGTTGGSTPVQSGESVNQSAGSSSTPTTTRAAQDVEPASAGPWTVFIQGALGGTATVGVVAGLAWVINRRRENAGRR